MKFRIAAVCPIVALAIAVPLPAQDGGSPKPIPFDAPGAATVSSPLCAPDCGTFALANNAAGAVTGYYTDPNIVPHGFLRAPNGHISSFDAPGAGLGHNLNQGTAAYSINDWGLIAGQFEDSSNIYQASCVIPMVYSVSSTHRARAQRRAWAP